MSCTLIGVVMPLTPLWSQFLLLFKDVKYIEMCRNIEKRETDVTKTTVFWSLLCDGGKKEIVSKEASLVMEKVNLPLCIFVHHAMKAYGRLEIAPQRFFF